MFLSKQSNFILFIFVYFTVSVKSSQENKTYKSLNDWDIPALKAPNVETILISFLFSSDPFLTPPDLPYNPGYKSR